jgi:hypothetical protein
VTLAVDWNGVIAALKKRENLMARVFAVAEAAIQQNLGPDMLDVNRDRS